MTTRQTMTGYAACLVFLALGPALLIFAGLVLATDPIPAADAIPVSITPHQLSLTKSYTRFVRCNVSSEYPVINPAACSLAIDGAGAILAVKVESHIEEHDTTVVFFDVDDVRVMLAEEMGEVTLTLTIDIDGDGDGDLFGSDEIMVTE